MGWIWGVLYFIAYFFIEFPENLPTIPILTENSLDVVRFTFPFDCWSVPEDSIFFMVIMFNTSITSSSSRWIGWSDSIKRCRWLIAYFAWFALDFFYSRFLPLTDVSASTWVPAYCKLALESFSLWSSVPNSKSSGPTDDLPEGIIRSPWLLTFLKNFWAWDLVWGQVLVPISFWIRCQFLPYFLRPCKNFMCSSSVHLPALLIAGFWGFKIASGYSLSLRIF